MNADWIDVAPCRGRGGLFYGPAGERPEPRALREARAAQVCAACPYRAECLDREQRFVWKADQIHGFLAGMTETERRIVWRRRNPNPDQVHRGAYYYDLVGA